MKWDKNNNNNIKKKHKKNLEHSEFCYLLQQSTVPEQASATAAQLLLISFQKAIYYS